ncbi:MAG: orotidine-5'-phosphate decarboxylase [Bdellovibrionales bacterium]
MLKNPIFVALDLDDMDQVRQIVRDAAPHVGGFKVGPRLCLRHGPAMIGELAKIKPVFIDNKYFDIPNTMTSAVTASFEAGGTFVTVHAQAGLEALSRLAELEAKFNKERPFKILAVTILTSFTQSGLPSVSRATPIKEQVLQLADLTIASGLSGLVCSAEEVALLRQKHPNSYLVVPGIRLPGQDKGDQNRVADPASALQAGASALVVGRPIVDAADPARAAQQFAQLAIAMRV